MSSILVRFFWDCGRQGDVEGLFITTREELAKAFNVAVDMLRAAWGDDLFSHEFTDKVASKLAKWEGVK